MDIEYLMDMTDLREIVTRRLAELGLGPVEAAVKAGMERSYIRDIVEGRKKNIRNDKLHDLAAALQLDATALLQNQYLPIEQVEELKNSKAPAGYVAVIGKVAANTWLSVDDMDFGYEDIEYVPSISDYPVSYQFGLSIVGNCLNKIANHGDRLVCLDIIKAHINVEPNDLVIVERSRYDGQMVERTAKRIRQTADGFELWPESNDPAHQTPIKLDSAQEGETVRLIGKVLWILRKP